MPRKSKAQLDRELAEELARGHHIRFQVPGGPLLWLTSRGTGSFSPEEAHDFGSREAAEQRIETLRGPRASASYRYATTQKRTA